MVTINFVLTQIIFTSWKKSISPLFCFNNEPRSISGPGYIRTCKSISQYLYLPFTHYTASSFTCYNVFLPLWIYVILILMCFHARRRCYQMQGRSRWWSWSCTYGLGTVLLLKAVHAALVHGLEVSLISISVSRSFCFVTVIAGTMQLFYFVSQIISYIWFTFRLVLTKNIYLIRSVTGIFIKAVLKHNDFPS